MHKKSFVLALSLGLGAMSGGAQASLYDRGGGLLYDDVLNVTWLQDANYAKTSGFSPNGVFKGSEAANWAATLVYHDSVRNVNFDDWRLPTVSPIGGSWDFQFSSNGSTDWGPNNRSPKNELSYMYFVNLGLNSFISADGGDVSQFGVFGDGTSGGQTDVSTGAVTVRNLQASSYWTGTPWVPGGSDYRFTFVTAYGETNAAYEYTAQYAWAVRDGDVLVAAAVPEPETYALMLAGLALVGATARRRKAKQA